MFCTLNEDVGSARTLVQSELVDGCRLHWIYEVLHPAVSILNPDLSLQKKELDKVTDTRLFFMHVTC